MRRIRAFLLRLGSLLRKERGEREFSAEMESHLQMHIEDNLKSGMSLSEARRRALIKLGGLEQTKEIYRERRNLPMLEVFLKDLRFAVRTIRKNPGFTFVAVLTLALGIAVNGTMFSFTNAVFLRKPPVAAPDRAVVVYGTSPAQSWGPNLNPVSSPNYFAWKRANHVFADIAAASTYSSVNLTGEGAPEHLNNMRVTSNYFSVLGVSAEIGRTFVEGEDQAGHDHVVILNHKLWSERFASDPRITGKQVRLNGENYTVVGVMPQRFLLRAFQADLWTPLVLDATAQGTAARENRELFLFARLKPGVTETQARAEMAAFGQLAERSFPDTEKGWGANVLTLQEYLVKDFNSGPAFIVMESAVGFVLLIACANVAGLMLARATSRGKEMAVRMALGASRWRIAHQLFTEAVLLSLCGGVLGLFLTYYGSRWLQANLSFNEEVKVLGLQVDWVVVAFTFGISILSAVLFGMAPAFQTRKVDVYTTLKTESGRTSASTKRSRLRSIIVAAEVALAVVLLICTSICLKIIVGELHQDMGFRPAQMITAQVALTDRQYKDGASQERFYSEVLDRLRTQTGVVSAAVSSALPATGAWEISFSLHGQENLPSSERAHARYFSVSHNYFETTGIPLLAGRSFTENDISTSLPVAIVSDVFAKKFFPKGDAVGSEIRVDTHDSNAAQWRQIVGVVGNVKNWPMQMTDEPEMYESYRQSPSATMSLIARANQNAELLASPLRESVWAVDKNQPVGSVTTMMERLNRETTGDRLFGGMMGTFAAMALVMAAIGLYGLVAYAVGQRSQEIGIRVALGADKKTILRLVVGDGMKLALAGAVLGIFCALPFPRLLQSMNADFHTDGRWIFTIVPLLMIAVALFACYIPARRAARIDPIIALRYE